MQKFVFCLFLMFSAATLYAHDAMLTGQSNNRSVVAAAPAEAAPSPTATTVPATDKNAKAEMAVAKLNKAVASYHVARHKGFVKRNWAKLKVAVAASKVAKADMGKDKKLIYILLGALAIIVAFAINSTLGFITLAVGATLFIIYLL